MYSFWFCPASRNAATSTIHILLLLLIEVPLLGMCRVLYPQFVTCFFEETVSLHAKYVSSQIFFPSRQPFSFHLPMVFCEGYMPIRREADRQRVSVLVFP